MKHSKGFTRWERGGYKEGSSSKSGETGASEKKVTGAGNLSQAELRERSRKGLCFKCGETWSRDHVCRLKHYKFVLMEGPKGEEGEESRDEKEETEVFTAKVLQLSLRSKEGLTSNRSFKILARIGDTKILVLMDCSASSNFISRKLVEQLKLEFSDTIEFEVEVGTGEKVRNRGVCKNLRIIVQGVVIEQHFFIMELGGTDVVLGMGWLESLGEVRANFKNLVPL